MDIKQLILTMIDEECAPWGCDPAYYGGDPDAEKSQYLVEGLTSLLHHIENEEERTKKNKMKPKIYVADADGKIKLTEEELRELVSESYNDGYRDGKMDTINSLPHYEPTPAIPNTVPSNPPVYPNALWYTHITCKDDVPSSTNVFDAKN